MMNETRPISNSEASMETMAARLCHAKDISDDIAAGIRNMYSALYGDFSTCEPGDERKPPASFSENLNLYIDSLAATREILSDLLNRMGI